MSLQSAALQSCFDEVADSAPMALERCLNQVVSQLQQAEGKSTQGTERAELGQAWRELLKHQTAWCRRYPDELRAAFKAAGTAPQPPLPAPAGSGPSLRDGLELALMDDADVEESIAAARLVQHLMPLVEQPVSELDALLSSAMGLPTVQPERNPVRPEVFAQGLRALIGHADMNPATGALWMKYMAQPLAQELQQLYGRLVVQLKHANVQAAEYRVRQAAAHGAAGRAGAPPGTAPASQADSAPATSYAAVSGRPISHALLRDFMEHGGGEQAAQPLPASYYAEVERELDHLKAQGLGDVEPPAPLPESYRELPPVERAPRAVGIQSTLSGQAWGEYAHAHERSLVRTQLRKDARQVAQVLGLELVRKVVGQIAQDPRLLTPVREAIVALEPSLLRLAMVDPRFFTEEEHPGRRLMERTAQRSFKYNDEFGAEFAAFFDGVRQCFNGLNQAHIAGPQPFEEALAALEAGWVTQDRLEADPRMQALRAMQFAEKRQAEADRIAWELGTRSDLEGVPDLVQDFLFGPWAMVLAHARLMNGGAQIDPHGYLGVITDLLWSVKPEVTLRQPAQLFERLPSLLGKLRAGLASIGQQPEESEPFFQALMQLHRPVLKLRRAKSRRDARESGLAPLGSIDVTGPADAEPQARDLTDEQPWMSVQELGALGFQDTLPTGMGDLWDEAESGHDDAATHEGASPPDSDPAVATPSPEAEPAAEEPPLDPAAVLALWREGDWVDLYSKQRWLRAQLIWASTRGTLFMFVSQGGRPHSMTKRICERLIRERFLRPVRMHGVVSHALDALRQDEAVTPST